MTFLRYHLLFLSLSALCLRADTIATPAEVGILNMTVALESYSNDNNGNLPDDIGSLSSYVNIGTLEKLGVDYYGEPIKIKGGMLYATTRKPIVEDRRDEVGRYVVYVTDNGKIMSDWESEGILRRYFEAAGRVLPSGSEWVQPETQWSNPSALDKLTEEERLQVMDRLSRDSHVLPEKGDDVRTEPEPEASVTPAEAEASKTIKYSDTSEDEVNVKSDNKTSQWFIYLLAGLMVFGVAAVMWFKARNK